MMNVLSQNENINNEQKYKSKYIMEDLDDLHKNLFGVPLSHSDVSVKKPSTVGTGENRLIKQKENIRELQKKVSFKGIDADEDILDDLLFDNSRNLSSSQKHEPSKNSHDIKPSSNNLLLTDREKSELKSSTGEKPIEYQSFINTEWESSSQKPNSFLSDKFDDTNEYFSFNFTPSSAGDKMSGLSRSRSNESKSSIMTELFPPSFSSDSINPTTVIATTTATITATSNINISSDYSINRKEPRRKMPKSNIDGISDPLGLLSGLQYQYDDILPTKKEKPVEPSESKPTTSQLQSSPDDLPEWLGGAKKNISESDNKPMNDIAAKNKKDIKHETKVISANVEEKNEYSTPTMPITRQVESLQEPFVLIHQQQENDLKNVTMLSEQTDKLINFFVENQQIQLNEQNKLFDTLIKRQIDRQSMLEAQIKLQQTRINHYIQALAKQSMITQSSSEHSIPKIEDCVKDNNPKVESQTSFYSIQSERDVDYMQNLLKQSYEREIDILKNSHETQISLMEESTKKLEIKLRQEMEDLQLDYEKKIEKIQNEKIQLETEYKEQIESLKANHTKVIQEIHTRQSENFILLQKEHFETIENITRAKELERDTVDFIKAQRTDINKMLEKSENVSDNLQTLYDEIKSNEKKNQDEREKNLKMQEELIKGLIQQLHKQQEDVSNERKKIVTTAEKLQSELSQLSSQFIKNNELLNERETRLEMQERALVRERELFQEQINWERQYLQNLKDAWMTNQKQQMKFLANEREDLAAEKSKLEVLNHLKANSNDITKTELEAAIKTAYEAVHEANLERQKWKEKVDNLHKDKQKIEEKELELMQRAKDLEELTQSALVKREEGMRALKEAQRIEKQHKDQLNHLRTQLQLLAERENRIAADKLALARERLELKVVCHQAEDLSKKNVNDSFFLANNELNEPKYIPPVQKQMHFTDMVDPQLLFLKINLHDSLKTSHLPMLTDLNPIK
ncbi:putative leucine-rich repeat-containing protein DDB_G0290503 [Chelonus insularis]|uniref:putative leucine-rich repeat-containing protein DDB_G0290503 n=1 Tax=Chelonus insularis TaxID=460826 RepID=UPI001589EE43|nr:putative leucine-rich repeat-containing protein DDB_G0290503 [Chelonus insularis]